MGTVRLKTAEERIVAEMPSTPVSVTLETSESDAARPSGAASRVLACQKSQPGQQVAGKAAQSAARPVLRKLSRKAKRAAILVPAIFMVLSVLVLEWSTGLGHQHLFKIDCLLMVGIPLALISGAMIRSKRLGSLAGSLLGLGFVLAFLAAFLYDGLFVGKTYTLWNWISSFVRFAGLISGCGALLGLAGASIREHGPRLWSTANTASRRRSTNRPSAAKQRRVWR